LIDPVALGIERGDGLFLAFDAGVIARFIFAERLMLVEIELDLTVDFITLLFEFFERKGMNFGIDDGPSTNTCILTGPELNGGFPTASPFA
jgi:hypothetical protein